jgi:aerobic carbon-monoxide dehydrogenase medium subunit
MKSAAFDLVVPKTLADASAALADGGEDARVIAGGQSLGPMLNLRLARPSRLIDLGRIPELRRVETRNGATFIGAMVTHAEIEDRVHDLADRGILASVAHGIAYRSVRNRGTIGGSLAHADPAADWLLTMTALAGSLAIAGRRGTRQVELRNFVRGAFATAIEPGEIVEGVLVPAVSAQARWGYYKSCRKPGEYADAMSAVYIDPEKRVCRIAVSAVSRQPVVLEELSANLAAKGGAAVNAAAIAGAVAAALPELDAIEQKVHATVVARAIKQAVVQ